MKRNGHKLLLEKNDHFQTIFITILYYKVRMLVVFFHIAINILHYDTLIVLRKVHSEAADLCLNYL
jgi:gamma-glutamyl:cysteine ligase YbdK (ATP-grasp superfamily)